MPVLDDLEVQIQNYFENLEYLASNYTWRDKLEIDTLTESFTQFSVKIKSLYSLYPDKRLRETPSNQLLSFLLSINTFLVDSSVLFIDKLLFTFETLNDKLFQILTNNQTYSDFITILNEIQLPELDFNFIRFFYSQIANRWIIDEGYVFSSFLADFQKINEIIPLLKKLFSKEIIDAIRQGTFKQILPTVNTLADQIEEKILIIPSYLSERLKKILIDLLTFIHTFPDVIVLQYDLDNLDTELLNKNLLFTSEFSQTCKRQIEIIRNIKKKIDLNPELFKKYQIDESVYITKISKIEKMIYSHNNILEDLNKISQVKPNSVNMLINDEISIIELLKNNMDFFTPVIKKLILSYIDAMIYLIDWWKSTKKSLLQQPNLYFLMFENIPQTEKIQLIKSMKKSYFKNFFSGSIRFFSFIEEVTGDLLPIFDHFTVIHKTIFNSLDDFEKWDLINKVDPIINSQKILDAIIEFFKRWNEMELYKSFESKLQSYNSEFREFYSTINEIFSFYKELKLNRFKKPEKSLQMIDTILDRLNRFETLIYNLFSTNLEIIKSIESLRNNISSFKIVILHYDRLDLEILELLNKNWDGSALKPFLKLMDGNLDKFPGSMQDSVNSERLKIVSLYFFITNIIQIENYLNDAIMSSITQIEKFSKIYTEISHSKPILINLFTLLPDNKKELIENFNRNLDQFSNIIYLNWINRAKKIDTFLKNQSKKISIVDRKTLLSQLENFKGTTISISFKWPIFEDCFKKYDKEFFPLIKKYFHDLINLEDHWQQTIVNYSSIKNFKVLQESLLKETENFIVTFNIEEFSNEFFIMINKNLENRLEMLKNLSGDSLSLTKMKDLQF